VRATYARMRRETGDGRRETGGGRRPDLYTSPMPRKTLYLSGDPKADALLTKEPLALLVGMTLDQQVR
jgi:hypothetical protein